MSSHGPDPASGRRHTTALLELAHVLDRALDPDTVARRVAESVLTLCEARSVGLYRLEPESGDLIGIAFAGDRGQDIPVIKAGTGTAGLALREGCPVTTSDPLSDPRIILTPQIRARFEQTGSRSVLAVPLRAKERLIGALTVRNRPGYVFDDAEVLLVQTFADLSALVLETARLFEASERQRRIAETLARMGRLLAQQLDVDLVMQRIAEGALTVFDALTANVQLIARCRPRTWRTTRA